MASREIDGPLLKLMVRAALLTLDADKEAVNALNVFPVPDGDTGANMTLTMQSAAREVERTGGMPVGPVAQALAQGSLMGARGNSGVILSQLFRGFAHSASDRQTMDSHGFARALQNGVDTAYRAVMKPVEGTILTVAREAAAAAAKAAKSPGRSMAVQLAATVQAAQQALARTPDLLPVLKKAGVVDAGGQGYCYILQGFHAAIVAEFGEDSAGAETVTSAETEPVAPLASGAAAPSAVAAPERAASRDSSPAGAVAFQIDEEISDIRFPYDTELFIRGNGIPLDDVRTRLETLGDCVYVVGGPDLAKVHIHTDNPGPVLDCCIRFGELIEIEIKNMRQQHEDLKTRAHGVADGSDAGQPDGGSPLPADLADAELAAAPDGAPGSAVVAVAAGDGLEAIFRSLGAGHIVSGGQTMNPSTEDILSAIQGAGTETVFVLPNNKNIVLAARQAAELSSKQVFVVPSRSVPQGIAALLTWQPDGDPAAAFESMSRALEQVQTGEITYAVRDTVIGDLKIKEGDILGIWNGDIAVTGQSPEGVLQDVLARMVDHVGGEVISVYYGAEIPAEKAEAVAGTLQGRFPDHEIEVHPGGQPLYYYLFSLE